MSALRGDDRCKIRRQYLSPGSLTEPSGAGAKVAESWILRENPQFETHRTSLANLHITILEKLGVPVEKLGDSTGKINLVEV